MAYYDIPSRNQTDLLIRLIGDPVATHLIEWGREKREKGEVVGLTSNLFTNGRFNEFINLAMKDKLEAEMQLIHAMSKDFIKVNHIK